MISKKQMILSKVRMDVEKRLVQGEEVGFNLPTVATTTFCSTHHHSSSNNNNTCNINSITASITGNRQKKRKLSLDTSGVGAVAVDDIMTPKDQVHPEEFNNETSMVILSSNKNTPSTTYFPKITKALVGRPRASSGANVGVPPRPRRSSSNGANSYSIASAVVNQQQANCGVGQLECCIKGCDNVVTNRLRFSLRCLTEDDFKSDFIQKSYNKVCHYHYFADLYRYKKANKAKTPTLANTISVTSNNNNKKKSILGQTLIKDNSISNNKRSRNEFELKVESTTTTTSTSTSTSMMSHGLFAPMLPTFVPIIAPLIIDNTNGSAPLFNQCKAVTPVSRQDASVFFNFVGLGLQNTFQRAM